MNAKANQAKVADHVANLKLIAKDLQSKVSTYKQLASTRQTIPTPPLPRKPDSGGGPVTDPKKPNGGTKKRSVAGAGNAKRAKFVGRDSQRSLVGVVGSQKFLTPSRPIINKMVTSEKHPAGAGNVGVVKHQVFGEERWGSKTPGFTSGKHGNTFCGSEWVGMLVVPGGVATVDGVPLYRAELHPMMLGCIRLAIEAKNWQKYRIRSIAFEYISSVPSTAGGTIAIEPQWDITENPCVHEGSAAIRMIKSSEHAKEVNCFNNVRSEMTFNDKQPFLFIQGSDENELTIQGAFNVYIVTHATTAASSDFSYGELNIHYEVEFTNEAVEWLDVYENTGTLRGKIEYVANLSAAASNAVNMYSDKFITTGTFTAPNQGIHRIRITNWTYSVPGGGSGSPSWLLPKGGIAVGPTTGTIFYMLVGAKDGTGYRTIHLYQDVPDASGANGDVSDGECYIWQNTMVNLNFMFEFDYYPLDVNDE